MKFESKFGIGEVCGYNEDARRGTERMDEILVKVVGITFDINGDTSSTVEHIGSQLGMQRFTAAGSMLNGDPDFNQETGYSEEQL